MDVPVNVPIDDPNADTEWNDILRKHGIIPDKAPDPEPIIQEAILEAQKRAHEKRLEDKDLDQLHELEDEEDDAFLEQYRKRRMAELSNLQKKSIHGQVYHLQKPDYAKDVTEASSKCFVLVDLTSSSDSNVESRVLQDLWRQIASKYGDIKFCQIRADMCIEGYPQKNTPTILVYKDGDIKRQIVTLREMNGPRTKIPDIEELLIGVGAIQMTDMRLKQDDGEDGVTRGSKVSERQSTQEDEDDWD